MAYVDWIKIGSDFLNGGGLQSYSESTIKTQGSYALKVVAAQTDSLNKTLTHTFATPIDLTGVNTLKLDMRSTRTGANVKVGLHDTGGTTTELTPTISSADTYETKTWDISGVADADKNAIDTFVITPTNADEANIFYVDNVFAPTALTRLFEETVTLTEVFRRGMARPFALETVTLSEVFIRGITKNWLDQVTLTEYYQRKASLFWVFSDEITLTEVFNFYRIYFKEFLDDITLTDLGLTRVFGKNFSEQITLTETFRRAITRSFIDIVILTEVGLKVIQLLFNEVVTLSENFVKGLGKRFTETVTLTESFRRAITRTWVEIITLTETFGRTTIYRKLFIDQITLTEVFRWWKSIKPKGGTWTKDSPGGGTWNKRNP